MYLASFQAPGSQMNTAGAEAPDNSALDLK